jgi:hypothetical protein
MVIKDSKNTDKHQKDEYKTNPTQPNENNTNNNFQNLMPTTDVDLENGMKSIYPMTINDELSLMNGSNVTNSVTHRINEYHENIKKVRTGIRGASLTSNTSSLPTMVEDNVTHRELATGKESLHFRQLSTPILEIIKSVESTLFYKKTVQQPIFDKYDMAFIVATTTSDDYYNLDHISSNDGEIPHIYDLLIQSEKWNNPNKNKSKIRIHAIKPQEKRIEHRRDTFEKKSITKGSEIDEG